VRLPSRWFGVGGDLQACFRSFLATMPAEPPPAHHQQQEPIPLQQQHAEKFLQGEQDHVEDLQALYERAKGAPCHVAQVETVTVNDKPLRTRPHLIDAELERVHRASTLAEIHDALEVAGRNLQQLGVFKRVDMVLNELPEVGARVRMPACMVRHARTHACVHAHAHAHARMHTRTRVQVHAVHLPACLPLLPLPTRARAGLGANTMRTHLSHHQDEPDSCSLLLELEEKNWYKVHAATYVQVRATGPAAVRTSCCCSIAAIP